MDSPSWKKKLAALGMVGGLAVLVVAALTQFVGGFTATVPVTVTSARSGLVMEPDAKVKLRGVEVGRVSSIEHTPDGAVLQLAMNPGQLHLIPSNAQVTIESTTVFGAKFVNLVVPEQADGYWEELSWEEARKYPADLILLDERDGDYTVETLDEAPGTLAAHPAVQAEQVRNWYTEFVLSYDAFAPILKELASVIRASRVTGDG